MATYYVTNGLKIRLGRLACWIGDQANEIAAHYKYGSPVPAVKLVNLQLMVAYLEAAECYTAITTAAQDGVNNCLTEAQMDNLFINIQEITGMCFPTKGETIVDNQAAVVANIK
jgi:hypothetical protein